MMSPGDGRITILFLVLLAAETSFGQLQPRATQSGGIPRMQRTAAQPEGWNAEIEGFLKRLTKAYADAQSYRDQGRVTMFQRQGRIKTTTEMPMELTFKRPNQLLLDGGQQQIACDGKSLVVAVGELRQYTSRPAPERLDRKQLQAWSVMGGVEQGHPELIDFLIRPDAYELWQKQMVKVSWQTETKVAGNTCRVLGYETVEGTKVRICVDAARMLLLRVQAEATSRGQDINVSYDLGTVTLDGSIEDKAFAFAPPADYRSVTQFSSGPGLDDHAETTHAAQGSETALIVGKIAANISGVDLQGRSFHPEEMRGKVTLLFFWSLAGGQYSLISLPAVQQAADYLQNKDVLVLGVSDDADKAEVIRQLMERKLCKFRTVFDEGQKLRHAYQIGGEPTFVIVGRDGKVAWARLGAPPTLRQDLITEVEKVLSSKASK
jgi:outer membrane lipoprotein-sorting protein/peroxiredoxin